VVRWSARAPQRAEMHTRQWVGTYADKGNGDYRGELASALQAITTYLKHFAFPPQVSLVRLDGQYGDAAVITQLILAGVYARDARERVSALGASPDPARAGSSADSKRDEDEHR
jgi:hypothetical protein